MQCATADDITIINFGMGSPGAATVMDLLSAISPESGTIPGQMRRIKEKEQYRRPDHLPIAAIRGEGTSNDYFLVEVPALPVLRTAKSAFPPPSVNMVAITGRAPAIAPTAGYGSMMLILNVIWNSIRAMAIDMETATIFSVGFYNKIPTGALLLVSDQPMIPEGGKNRGKRQESDY